MSLNKDSAWLKANIEYIKRSQRNQELLVRQLTLWQRLDEKERKQIDDLSRSQFAMRLLDAEYNDKAEAIAIELFKDDSKEPMLAKLLGRLAVFYRNYENPGKAQKFEQALEQQLQRSL